MFHISSPKKSHMVLLKTWTDNTFQTSSGTLRLHISKTVYNPITPSQGPFWSTRTVTVDGI